MEIVEIRENEKEYNYANYYGVTWEVTANCNFKCRYCKLNSKESFKDPSKVIDFINELNKKYTVSTTLFGGEPTQHPQIIEIVEKLESKIQLFTNLSAPLSLYEHVLDLKPDTRFETSYHNDRRNFEEYYEKIKVISNRSRMTVYLMLDTNYSGFEDMYNRLSQLNLEVCVLRVVHEDQRDLTKEEDRWFQEKQMGDNITVILQDSEGIREIKTTVGYIYANGLNNFKFYNCLCGSRNMYISSEGKCYPCLDYKKSDLSFFDINNPDDASLKKVLSKGTVCKMDFCSSEISTPKKRILKRHVY